jgi:5-methyltetrahydrofolate--homocysteine methyltransferase
VIGSIGPGTKLVSLGQTTWDELLASALAQARGLVAGGVDALMIPSTPTAGAGAAAVDSTHAPSQAAPEADKGYRITDRKLKPVFP